MSSTRPAVAFAMAAACIAVFSVMDVIATPRHGFSASTFAPRRPAP